MVNRKKQMGVIVKIIPAHNGKSTKAVVRKLIIGPNQFHKTYLLPDGKWLEVGEGEGWPEICELPIIFYEQVEGLGLAMLFPDNANVGQFWHDKQEE